MNTNYFRENSSKEINKVYFTNDLTMFKEIIGNRPPNPKHIKRLAQSIKDNGLLCNPILVNEKFEVIDGQHRLLAARQANSGVYYIILQGYNLNEVHALNLNQKNWTQKDYMNGYAEMGIKSYQELKSFVNKNNEFSLRDCIAMCSNLTGFNSDINQKYRKSFKNKSGVSNVSQVFEEGTWESRDLLKAQINADKLKMIGKHYDKYARSTFVGAMLGIFEKPQFDFNSFMHKLKLQPTALVDCANREQTKQLIEDIYNYRRSEKVNLRF